MPDESSRVIEQRVRNRIMEAILMLARGDAFAREVGHSEYFESFYDFVPHQEEGGLRLNSAINAEERRALEELSKMVGAACDATPKDGDAADLLGTGWPARIQPLAQHALALMDRRGRFSEDREELEPSVKG